MLIQTDWTLAKTGFGRNAKALFEYLYKTGKYDLVNFACGTVDIQLNKEIERTPWKTISAVNVSQIENIKKQNDPKNWESIERMASYGAYALDNAIKEEKPDVFFGVQDIWGIDFSVNKKWFKNITSVLWTTLDSLPILDSAVEAAKKSKNYWCWSDFATKALNGMGYSQVKTVHGAVDSRCFYRLSDRQKFELREKFKINQDTFIVGFVFRNQLRKSVPNLLQGFKMFKQNNPKAKTKLLLHTSWVEGWDIPKFIKEFELSNEDILTTYICKNCGKYEIKSFSGNDLNCPFCKTEKTQTTTNTMFGVSEQDLNEIYNLMDVYCHPFTSGGQEIPIQEAKLAELITLVTNYSCGEDCCVEESYSIPLDFSEYREPGTQFIKASTYPSSISKGLTKVYNMDEKTRSIWGEKARKFTLENYSIEKIGKIIENFIDSAPFIPNEDFVPSNETDDKKWLEETYMGFLGKEINENSEEFRNLINV